LSGEDEGPPYESPPPESVREVVGLL